MSELKDPVVLTDTGAMPWVHRPLDDDLHQPACRLSGPGRIVSSEYARLEGFERCRRCWPGGGDGPW